MNQRRSEAKQVLPAVVIGSHITALGTLRSLARHKIKVFLDCDALDLARKSRYYNHANFLTDNYSKINFDALAKLPFEKLVLIPCSDRFVRQLTKIPKKYENRFLISGCSMDVLSHLVFKNNFAKQVSRFNISVPRSFVLTSSKDIDDLPESAFTELFLKPVSSALFIDRYNVKAMRVLSKIDALEKFKMVRNDGFDVILQEYIPGPSQNHYFIDGFLDRHGHFKAFFARQRDRIYPVDFGNSSSMHSVPLDNVKSALEDIKKLLNGICYRGIFSVEFKKDQSDGRLKMIEVNARCWMYVQYATDCGINMPLMAYYDAQNIDVEYMGNYRNNTRCVYPLLEFKSFREKITENISFIALLWSWVGAKQPVFYWRDPMPAFIGSLRIIRSAIKKLIGLKK